MSRWRRSVGTLWVSRRRPSDRYPRLVQTTVLVAVVQNAGLGQEASASINKETRLFLRLGHATKLLHAMEFTYRR